jgi:hypothetical protein
VVPQRQGRQARRCALSAPLCAPLACALLLSACAEESRETRYWTPLSNVPGAIRGDDAQPESAKGPTLAEARQSLEQLYKEDERGRQTLLLSSPRQALGNLRRLLDTPAPIPGAPPAPPDPANPSREPLDPDALMLQQLLSERTIRQMRSEGKEPAEAVRWMRANAPDIQALIARMPFAEQSVDVEFNREPQRQYRMRLRAGPARGLRFDTIWLASEGGILPGGQAGGQWRIVWVGKSDRAD